MVKVNFTVQKKSIDLPAGTNLLEATTRAGVAVDGSCGGKGTCGKCKVKIAIGETGNPTPAEIKHLSEEELRSGYVLACKRTLQEDTAVEVEAAIPQDDSHWRKTTLQGGTSATAAPSLEKIAVSLKRPTVEDQTPDLERLLEQLPRKNIRVSRRILATLPETLRKAGFAVTAVLAGDRLIAVEPGETTTQMYGLAFDIGTTTIMGSLMDLTDGSVMAVAAATNPQNVYGADVISRISHAVDTPGGLAQLQEKVIGAANAIIRDLLKQTGIDQNQIYEVTAAGNTTMSHLFLGINPANLAPAPFIPAYRRPVEAEAAELGLEINPCGRVMVLPNIAGYVGSDTVAVILATALDRRSDAVAAIDIGTNGELVLAARGRVLTCSTAAGPAFEGAQIKHGMRAADGAIEAVRVADADLRLSVIGDSAPRGLCGSGLIDAIAVLYRAGVIEPSGRFIDPDSTKARVPERLKERLRPGKGGFEFILAPAEQSVIGEAVVLTQSDLRELQLAKGAIYAGLQVLLREAGVSVVELDEILLAGAFGNYINKESALLIGLLPAIPPERITPVGNAAGDGAKMALVSRTERERAFAMPAAVEHIELSTRVDFQDAFIDALAFPPLPGV